MSADKELVALIRLDGEPQPTLDRVLKTLGTLEDCDRRCRWHGGSLLIVRLEAAPAPQAIRELEAMSGVRRVELVRAGFPLAQRRPRQPDSVVQLPGGARIGAGSLAVIAGPCSVESEEQIIRTASIVKQAGAIALRGGAFKPRTSPYSFGGLGKLGLEHLARARKETGLPVVTEVLDAEHLDLVARHADMLQIGSRNMYNTTLLFKAGSHPSGKPILLKRGFGATVEELLHASEYVLLGRLAARHRGPGLVLCERGIRTFEPAMRFTLDLGAVVLLKERSHLPVVVDPSHAAGERRYVGALARAAIAAGADGLLVEVHPNPDAAWSDAAQCLDPAGFRNMMAELSALVELRPDQPSRKVRPCP